MSDKNRESTRSAIPGFKAEAAGDNHFRSMSAFREVGQISRMHLTIQKLVGDEWVKTAKAITMEACENHAQAVGGLVRVLDKHGTIVAEWYEGARIDV